MAADTVWAVWDGPKVVALYSVEASAVAAAVGGRRVTPHAFVLPEAARAIVGACWRYDVATEELQLDLGGLAAELDARLAAL